MDRLPRVQSFSKEQLKFLRTHCGKMGLREVALKFRKKFKEYVDLSQIRFASKNHKFSVAHPDNRKRTPLLNEKQHVWLVKKYQKHPLNELVPLFNAHFETDFSGPQLRGYLKRNKITCSRSGQFRKGDKPPPSAHPKGPNAGSFKKGNRPHNVAPVGTECWASIGYLKRKIAEPNVWGFIHILTWEEHHGPVPEGHVIRFKDGDRKNCRDINNLVCVDYSTNAVLTTLFNPLKGYDNEMRSAAILTARLHSKTLKLERKLTESEKQA